MSLGSIVMSRWLSRAAKACTDRTEPLWKRILRIMLGLLVIATFTLYFVGIFMKEDGGVQRQDSFESAPRHLTDSPLNANLKSRCSNAGATS